MTCARRILPALMSLPLIACGGGGAASSAAAPAASPQPVVAAFVAKLQDTGVTASQCFAVGSVGVVACGSAGAIALNDAQDGMLGLDVSAPDGSDGALGASYGALAGGCVKDNLSGLTWEVKTADGGLRDKTKKYTNIGDGSAAEAAGLVAAVNAAGLCGYNDWRLPTVDELQGIANLGVGLGAGAIDATWFPNTMSSLYWSSSGFSKDPGYAWTISFGSGFIDHDLRTLGAHVRLVR